MYSFLMKKNINITIDENLYLQLKDSGKPISTTINELLFRALSPKESNQDEEKLLLEQLALAKKLNLDEREFFLLKDNFDKDVIGFWRLNKQSFTNVKSIFELIEIKKAFEPLFASQSKDKIQEVKQ